jgi:hypothetical protein
MNITPRKSRQIVEAHLRSSRPIQADTLVDVAKDLRRKQRGGSIEEMVSHLQKALRGNRLFEYKAEGQTFYETKEARRRRCGIPKRAPKSVYINATEPALS